MQTLSQTPQRAESASVAQIGASGQPDNAQPRIWFRFMPEDGWLTVLLVIAVIYLTISSIQIVTPPWTPVGLYILTPIMAVGIVLGYLATQQRVLPDALTHLIVTALGLLFAFYETVNVVAGGNWQVLFQHTLTW
ncbi:MAG TPA: hypothetical protein VKQ36_13680, partial [Ktedonobacterales bacterium]|nr:hypothetical protein [Ktedonobacterales bacterium]